MTDNLKVDPMVLNSVRLMVVEKLMAWAKERWMAETIKRVYLMAAKMEW